LAKDRQPRRRENRSDFLMGFPVGTRQRRLVALRLHAEIFRVVNFEDSATAFLRGLDGQYTKSVELNQVAVIGNLLHVAVLCSPLNYHASSNRFVGAFINENNASGNTILAVAVDE